MSKRLLIAMAIWMGFFVIMMQFMPKQQPADQTAATNQQSTPVKDTVNNNTDLKSVSTNVLAKGWVSEVKTERYRIQLNRTNGVVDQIVLQDYKDGGTNIHFIEKVLDKYGNFRISFNGLEGVVSQADIQFSHTVSSNKQGVLFHTFSGVIPEGPGKGLELKKIYSFYKDKYFFDLNVVLRNPAKKIWKNNGNFSYSLVWGSPIEWALDKKSIGSYDRNNIVYVNRGDGSLEEVDEKGKFTDFTWFGLSDRYFLMAIIPVDKNGDPSRISMINSATARPGKDNKKRLFALHRYGLKLGNNEKQVDSFRVFLGPKKYDLLTSDELNKYKLHAVFDGFVLIKWLAIGCEKLIYAVYDLFKNYGIAIIIVTILIKILLYPLTHKSFVSMRKMQTLQPKLNALKEQYKKDPQVMNKKMMELYKKEGVNPMGGCLPLLLQLPIFIALYQVLPRLVDLKNVSFLWIKDLSSPDTVATFEMFRNIPVIPTSLNILPLIMTAVSVLQSKLSTGGASAQQQQQNKFMMMMPVMFLFIFWNMPSGLVLYWTVQNILSIVQQLIVNKKLAVPEPASH